MAKQILETRQNLKIAREPNLVLSNREARLAAPSKAALILRHKFNGRPLWPPTKWLPKSRLVLSWSISTTKLELILPKISEKIQSLYPVAVPPSGIPRRKIAFTISDLRAPPKNSSKGKGNFSARLRAQSRGVAGLRLRIFLAGLTTQFH